MVAGSAGLAEGKSILHRQNIMKSADEFIYGLRPLIEAVESGREIERVYIRKNLQGELYQQLADLIKKRAIPYQLVPVEKLNRITRKNHQGIVAYVSHISYHAIDQLIPNIYESGEDPLVVVLDGITDVGNFGAIARTAECAGVHSIIVPWYGSAPVNADSLKTSAGALSRIPVCRVQNIFYTVRYLKNSGLRICSATEKAEGLYFKASLTGPLAIIIGSEDKGIDSGLLKVSDDLVRIPLMGQISSLNVSVAAGILIYEAVKQRGKA
jgi:23S rRNA (guanosine2251-2'-O)-methyltransferase